MRDPLPVQFLVIGAVTVQALGRYVQEETIPLCIHQKQSRSILHVIVVSQRHHQTGIDIALIIPCHQEGHHSHHHQRRPEASDLLALRWSVTGIVTHLKNVVQSEGCHYLSHNIHLMFLVVLHHLLQIATVLSQVSRGNVPGAEKLKHTEKLNLSTRAQRGVDYQKMEVNLRMYLGWLLHQTRRQDEMYLQVLR